MWPRIVGLVVATTLLWPAPSVVQRVAEPTQRAVMIATMPCQRSLQATSSGFMIADGLVVTVAHAIYDTRDFAVRDSTGVWHRPSVRYMDLERDLAVLELPALTTIAIDTRRAGSGDEVRMLAGAASGTVEGHVIRRVRLTTEVVGDLTETTARSGYELSIAIKGGDSGAAVLDDQDRLVGIVFARSTKRDASWATSVTEIDDVLDRRGGPTWECERDSDVELVLASPDETEHLAP